MQNLDLDQLNCICIKNDNHFAVCYNNNYKQLK